MITKTLHDNKFIGIYEEYNYRIIAKVAEYICYNVICFI